MIPSYQLSGKLRQKAKSTKSHTSDFGLLIRTTRGAPWQHLADIEPPIGGNSCARLPKRIVGVGDLMLDESFGGKVVILARRRSVVQVTGESFFQRRAMLGKLRELRLLSRDRNHRPDRGGQPLRALLGEQYRDQFATKIRISNDRKSRHRGHQKVAGDREEVAREERDVTRGPQELRNAPDAMQHLEESAKGFQRKLVRQILGTRARRKITPKTKPRPA